MTPRQASQLEGRANGVACYRFWGSFTFPTGGIRNKACRGLIGLSNSLFNDDAKGNKEYLQQIREGLGGNKKKIESIEYKNCGLTGVRIGELLAIT